jgi:hypothetical protein
MAADRGDVPRAGAGTGPDRALRSQPAPPAPIPLSFRYLVIGVLAEAEEQVQRRAAGPVTTLGRTLRPVGRRIARLPLVDAGGRRAAASLSRLAERGRREEENYRRRADDVVRHAASAAVRSPALDDLVDEVAIRLAGPVVDAQLPLVLARLSERPDSLRRIVDETADRFANRFLQRPTDISQ